MSIRDNLASLKESIALSAQRAGRSPEEIRLMIVSKTQEPGRIQETYDAGQRLFGENRVAEGAEKFALLPGGVELHMIGHLQRNKVKLCVTHFDCIQSLDSWPLANKVLEECRSQGKSLSVLLQLKTAEEGGKTGFSSEEELRELAHYLAGKEEVTVKGLMTIAPFVSDEFTVRKAFNRCARLYEDLQSLYPHFSVLSMGMSGDYPWAIQEGANLLRIGSAVFGAPFV